MIIDETSAAQRAACIDADAMERLATLEREQRAQRELSVALSRRIDAVERVVGIADERDFAGRGERGLPRDQRPHA
jgi:hypothetical protein